VSATFYLFQKKEVKKRGLLVLGLGGVLYLLYAIYLVGSDLITRGHMDYGRDRYFATVLLFFLPFSLLNAKIAQGKLSRYLWMALSVMISSMIIIVGVRGGWIALSFVLILWYLLTRRERSVNKKGVVFSLLATLVILLATVSLFPDYFREMKGHTLQKIQLSLRFEAWQGYLDLSLQSPVLGHGLSEEEMKKDYRSHYTKIKGHPPGPYKPLTPHNQYLQLFYRQGVIGVGLYMLILALVVKELLKGNLRPHTPPTFNLLFFYASSLSLLGEYLIRCMLEDRSLIPFSFLLGLVLSSEKEETPSE
ncbi:MAG: O-antigen ligase domain-containing protein, partial [Nitrospirae bacterium]